MRDARLISWAKRGEKDSGDNNSAPMLRIKYWQLEFERLFINLKAFFPFFKTLATVFFQLLMARKPIFAGFFNGLIKFTVIIGVLPANPGSMVIDTTNTAR
jgi:hypothetical protein